MIYTSIISVVFSTLFIYFMSQKLFSKYKNYTETKNMLKIHNKLTRKVYACFNCNRQLFPVEVRYSCGICEYHDYCKKCWSIANKNNKLEELHSHYLYHDYVFPEVDSSSLHHSISVADSFSKTMDVYSVRSLIGIRKVKKMENNLESEFDPDFTWISYYNTKQISLALGQGILSLGNMENGFIGICGVSSTEWLLTQYSCFFKGLIPVPIHPSFNSIQLAYIISKSNISVLFISKHLIQRVYETLGKLENNHSLKYIVLINDYACAYPTSSVQSNDILNEFNVTVKEWKEIKEIGENHPEKQTLVHKSANDIGMLLSTSGSSGMPKLTVFSCSRIQNIFKGARPLSEQMVTISIEPIRQSMDLLCKGGRIGIYCGRLDKLGEDIKCLRPTVIGATPSYWCSLYSEYQVELKNYLKNNIASTEIDFMSIYKEKHLFGNRLKAVLTGGAPLNNTIQDWLFIALGSLVVNGYGTTETGGLSSSGHINPGVQVQLVDCPELGYLTSDIPYARGEILASSDKIIDGYYNDKVKTEEAFTTINGKRYFKTGDIGRIKNGKIEIIDRKKSMLKLAQGCFVAPEYLETIYINSSYIKQIFIFGDSRVSCVGAIVIPSKILNNMDTSSMVNKIRNDLRKLGMESELKPWEIPQTIILEETEFTVANGLLTTIGKMARPNLIKKYKPKFEALWNKNSDITSIKEEKQEEVEINNTGLCHGVAKLIGEILNIPLESFHGSNSIQELGSDSLVLARLCSTIKKRFGSEIPLPALFKFPNLFVLETAIFSGMSSVISQLSDSSLSKDFLENEVTELTEKLCNTVDNITPLPLIGNDILLTGSNGFLGCFLLFSILNNKSKYGNRNIICIVRGKDDIHAKNRLQESIKYYNIDIVQFDRIKVIAGDISKHYFGLNKEDYFNLCKSVSIIFHNAAMVNSVYSYEQHKPTNVNGVVEILKFISYSQPSKELHHISTVGMLGSSIEEQKRIKLTESHEKMGGYGQSKWVGEQLILNYSDKYSINFNIYRPSTIFSSQNGASNPKDTIIGMICGLIREKLYCHSLLESNEANTTSMLPGEMNLVSVDWVAESIVTLSENCNNVYHLTNNNITSIKQIIDFIQKYGIELKLVHDKQFTDQIESIIDENHPFFMFKSIIVNKGYAKQIVKPICDNTNIELGKYGRKAAGHIDYDLFENTLHFLQETKRI